MCLNFAIFMYQELCNSQKHLINYREAQQNCFVNKYMIHRALNCVLACRKFRLQIEDVSECTIILVISNMKHQ